MTSDSRYFGKRNRLLALLLCIAISFGAAIAQNAPTGCPSIHPAGTVSGADTTIQGGGCLWLHADVTATATTANDYTVSQIQYNPPFSYTAGNQISLNQDDYYAAIINLPFAFCFYGQTYRQACVGANGVVSFNAGNNGQYCAYSYSSNLPIPNAGFPQSLLNSIYGVCEDIWPGHSSGGGRIFQGVLGSYPCRTACISYDQCPLYGNYTTHNSYQIVLYEGTNIIDVYIHERNCCSSTNNGYGLVGVQNATGTMAVAAPNRNGGTWTAYNEAWRFTPTGTPNYIVTWYDGTDTSSITGTILGHDTIRSDTAVSRIYVCPRGANVFTARLRYTACNGDHFDIINTTTITSSEVTFKDTSFCHSGPYVFHGRTLTRSGMYYDTIRNSAGCDSIVERLHLKLATTYTDRVSACNQYTWMDGETYTHSTNTPTFHLQNHLGCDSTITLNLIIENTSRDTIYDTICNNTSYYFAGNYLTEPGVYYDSNTTAHGCDSITVLFLEKLFVNFPSLQPDVSIEEICLGTTISRTDVSSETQGNTYFWVWGDGYTNTTRGGESVSHTYSVPGTYNVLCAILAPNGCRDSVYFRVVVYDYSRASFSWDPPIITMLSPNVYFHNLTRPHDPQRNNYLWHIFSDDTPTGTPVELNDYEPQYQWQITGNDVGNYLVRLIAFTSYTKNDGTQLVCSDTTETLIYITNDFLQFPNTVSANGDGINDIFEIKNLIEGRGFTDTELYIYNSWGRKVFYKKNITKKEDFWDPALNNDPSGTYYYRFSAKGYKGNVQRNGTVEVLR